MKFQKHFSNAEECYKYLASIKWGDEYKCRKCDNTNYCKGKQAHSRRCTRCKYDESATKNTGLERIGIDLCSVFHMLYRLSVDKKGMSSYELAREYEISQLSCWNFRTKVQMAMKSSEKFPLEGNVDVDEFLVGGPEEGKRGRSKGKKKLVIVALERLNDGGFGRAYAKHIQQSSTEEFTPFFKEHIALDAHIRTDKWPAYNALKENYPNLEQIDSNNGLNFREMHIHIMNFKGWLRGIHHHCSQKHMQGYLDEYHFRFNRRNHMETIFHKLAERMVNLDLSTKMKCDLN